MRYRNFYKYFFALILLYSMAYKAKGQNINNMQIGVSATSITVLKFNSRITHVEFGNRDYYTSQVRDDDNSLVIKTIADTAAITNLYVNEGKRGHLFTVVFLPAIDFNHTRLWYDFSNLKALKKLVDDLNQGKITNIIPDQRASSLDSSTFTSDEEAVARHAKDSAAAAETIRQQGLERKKLAKAKVDFIQAQKAEDIKIAKAKADAEATQKAEEMKLAKAKAEAEAAQKAEEERLAKAKADAEIMQRAEEIRLARANAAAEVVQKVEASKQARAKADSIQKKEREKAVKARLDSIQAQMAINATLAKRKLDSIQALKERNALLAKQQIDSIQARREENTRVNKAKLDSIQAEKDKAAMIIAERKKKISDSLAALPKFYSHVELWLKYPKLIFEVPPVGQYLAGDYFIDRDTLENARVSYLILNDTPKIQHPSDTVNNLNFILQGIYFSGTNCYMSIHIQNKSKNDYLVGPINVRWYTDSGKIYDAYPCFITSYPSQGLRTSFPALAPGVDETIVLTTRALNVKKNDYLKLTMGDRLGNIYLELTIPANEYNTPMDQSK